MSFAIASNAACDGFVDPYVPRSAIPTDPVLKPSACAPMTLRSIPPYRPS